MTQDKTPPQAPTLKPAPMSSLRPSNRRAAPRLIAAIMWSARQESVQAIETISQQPVALQVAAAPQGSAEDSTSAELPASYPTAAGCAARNTSSKSRRCRSNC